MAVTSFFTRKYQQVKIALDPNNLSSRFVPDAFKSQEQLSHEKALSDGSYMSPEEQEDNIIRDHLEDIDDELAQESDAEKRYDQLVEYRDEFSNRLESAEKENDQVRINAYSTILAELDDRIEEEIPQLEIEAMHERPEGTSMSELNAEKYEVDNEEIDLKERPTLDNNLEIPDAVKDAVFYERESLSSVHVEEKDVKTADIHEQETIISNPVGGKSNEIG